MTTSPKTFNSNLNFTLRFAYKRVKACFNWLFDSSNLKDFPLIFLFRICYFVISLILQVQLALEKQMLGYAYEFKTSFVWTD